MGTKLGGWQRLWCVTAVLYAVAVAAVAWLTFPTVESVQHHPAFYSAIPPEVRARILNTQVKAANEQDFIRDAGNAKDVELNHMPNGHTLVFRAGLNPADVETSVQAYWAAVEHAATEKRTGHIFLAFSWWALPLIFVYAFGIAVRWVSRGFKQK